MVRYMIFNDLLEIEDFMNAKKFTKDNVIYIRYDNMRYRCLFDMGD